MVDSAPTGTVGQKLEIREKQSLPNHQLGFWPHHASGPNSRPSRRTVSFTGNAFEDFSSGSIAIHDDGNLPNPVAIGGFLEDSDVRTVLIGQRSGFDMRNIFWKYDPEADIMYVGVDCYGVCGDIDGDGDPDRASTAFSILDGVDTPSLSHGEFLLIGLDTKTPGSTLDMKVDVLIGSKVVRGMEQNGYRNFSIQLAQSRFSFPSLLLEELQNFSTNSNFTILTPSSLSPTIVGLVDPALNLASHDFNSSFGDIEFAITHFSMLPGINWNPLGPMTTSSEPGYGKMAFSFVAAHGSLNSPSLVGIDHLPNQTQGYYRGQRVIIECPWLPLDSLGDCCKPEDRDLCGVCFGNNAFLDPCGSCRRNASAVPSTSCPAAVHQWSMIDTAINSSLLSQAPFISVDINLDGNLDLVIGMPELNLVYIRFLDPNGLITGMATITNPNASDASPDDEFGASIASPSDINGDGVPDLVVGAPGYNGTGAVYVLLMQPSGVVATWQFIDSGLGSLPGASFAGDCTPRLPPPPSPTTNLAWRSAVEDEGVAVELGDDPTPPDFSYSPLSDPSVPSSFPTSPSSINSPSDTPIWEASPIPEPSSDSDSPSPHTIFPPPIDDPEAPPPECSPSDTSPSAGSARFGASLIWLGRYMLLISAPGAPARNMTALPTAFTQHGRLLLVALATDGTAIGMYTLQTILTNNSAIAAGVNVTEVTDATLGRTVRLMGTVGPNSRLVASVHWTMSCGAVRTSMIILNVKPDGSIQSLRPVILPASPVPLPPFPWSPLLPSAPVLAPNFFPVEPYNTALSLEGAGDIDGDGAPDLVFGLEYAHASGTTQSLLLVCLMDHQGLVRKTQLIGPGGIGHLSAILPPGYRFGSFIHNLVSPLPIAGISGHGAPVLLVSAISVNSTLLVIPISLWGVTSPSGPTSPAQPALPVGPPSPASNVPIGLSPSSIAPPSPEFPLVPRPSTDAVAVEFIADSPQLKVYCTDNPDVFVILTLNRIIERPSGQIVSAPLKTLRPPPPSSWSKQVSSDGLQTAFTANMVTEQGNVTNVELEVHVASFSDDKTIIFNPSSYLGVTHESIKFSFLVRGWTFTQSKTVLDLIVDVHSNDPFISVDTRTESSPERYTRFELGSISSQIALTVPSFASIDGVLTTVSPPRFNQTTGQLYLTAPPFFDTLFYDPDVTIKTRYDPSGIKHGKPGLGHLLWVVIPSVLGVIIIIVITAVLITWLCRHRKAEQRWKDAGEIT